MSASQNRARCAGKGPSRATLGWPGSRRPRDRICPDKPDSAGAAQRRGTHPHRARRRGGPRHGARRRRHRRDRLRGERGQLHPQARLAAPVLGGGSSQVYASDGTRLGFIQSDDLRSPVAWSEIPTDLKNATVAIEDQRFYKNDGVDLTGHLPRGRQGRAARRSAAGRLDDHDAADAQPLPRRRPAHAQAEDHRGQAGPRLRESPQQALHPHELPQQRPLRHRRRPDGRWACRRPRGSSSTNPPPQLDLAAVGAARRPAPGALGVQPVRSTRRAARDRRNEVLAKMAELHYITPPRRPPRRARAAGGRTRATSTPSAARTSSSNTSASSSTTATAGTRSSRAG